MKLLMLAAVLGSGAPAVSPPPVVVTTPPPPVASPPPPIMVPLPPAPPMKPGVSGPVPLGSPGGWVSTDDYPASALRLEQQGTTRFRLTVGVDGRVTDCNITESSGTAVLDATACIKITQRARFHPAMDAEANPVIGTYSNAVRWTIPEDIEPLPALGGLVVTFVLGTDGTRSQCRIVSSYGEEALEHSVGAVSCPEDDYRWPFVDESGPAVPTRITLKTVTVAREPGIDAETGPDVEALLTPGKDLALNVGTFVRSSIVETSGKQTNCRVVSVSGAIGGQLRRGVTYCYPSIFITPFLDAKGQPVRRQLLISTTVTLGDPTPRVPVRKPVRRRK